MTIIEDRRFVSVSLRTSMFDDEDDKVAADLVTDNDEETVVG